MPSMTRPPESLKDRLATIIQRGHVDKLTSDEIAEMALAALNDDSGLGTLTAREREVLALIKRGLSLSETAVELGISPQTVEVHRKHLYSKLGVSSAGKASIFAAQTQ